MTISPRPGPRRPGYGAAGLRELPGSAAGGGAALAGERPRDLGEACPAGHVGESLPGRLEQALAFATAWTEDPRRVAAECADTIASACDLLWPSPKDNRAALDPARVISAVASGLVLLAGCPGGVIFAGRHWCTARHADCPGIATGGTGWGETSRQGTGAVHTPPWLAEAVTGPALDALLYRPGPLQVPGPAGWQLLRPPDIEELRIADISCGSGAFLLAACRRLARALSSSWQAAGDPRGGDLAAAARIIAGRCLVGADINPAAAALSKLALQLLTYQPGQPVISLDHAFIAGDSLLGINWQTAFPAVMARGGFDAVIGNPPFLGGQKITAALGGAYRARMVNEIARGRKGAADLAAYFLLRGWDLIGRHGQLAILATNTLAQGTTRRVGLDQVVSEGGEIIWAVKSAPWPDARASLEYCAAVISKAPVAGGATHPGRAVCRLGGIPVISTGVLGRILAKPAQADGVIDRSFAPRRGRLPISRVRPGLVLSCQAPACVHGAAAVIASRGSFPVLVSRPASPGSIQSTILYPGLRAACRSTSASSLLPGL